MWFNFNQHYLGSTFIYLVIYMKPPVLNLTKNFKFNPYYNTRNNSLLLFCFITIIEYVYLIIARSIASEMLSIMQLMSPIVEKR
jgi:hypothetical protein